MYFIFFHYIITHILNIFFFFFKGYGDHRDLHNKAHSFPTRRSSDLLGERRPGVTGHPASISQRGPQATYLRDRLDERRRLLLRLRDRVDPLVSPLRRRVLLTVAAAMRLAVPVLRPRLLAERLIFSYCRSRLLLQDLGIPAPRRRK